MVVLAKARKAVRWLGLLKRTNMRIALKRKLPMRIIIGRKEAISEGYY